MYSKLLQTIRSFQPIEITSERDEVLQELVDYIKGKNVSGNKVNLNFICTHNSRRSQFAQIWAQTAAAYYKIDVSCFSGGVEVTAFNQYAVDAIERAGFSISKTNSENPIYSVLYSDDDEPITAFSKLFDDIVNPTADFAAVMTCSDADENCPFIPGTDKRIPLLYEDPKEFDDSPQVAMKYDERSSQIASEMFYVFSKVKET